MTKPVFTDINCSVCGRTMGRRPGVQVVLGAVCEDPICDYQTAPTANFARDSLIVAAILEGIPVSQVAFATGMTRQRVYQIYDSWRQGV